MKNQNIGFTRSARLFRLVPALAVTALIAVIMQVTGPFRVTRRQILRST